MSLSAVEYLRHILDETIFISNSISGVTEEEFNNNELLQKGIVRSIEIIGEAVKKIPTEINIQKRIGDQ